MVPLVKANIPPYPLPQNRPQHWTIRPGCVDELAKLFASCELRLAKGALVEAQIFYDACGVRRKLQARYENNALVTLKFVPGKRGFVDVEVGEQLCWRGQLSADELAA